MEDKHNRISELSRLLTAKLMKREYHSQEIGKLDKEIIEIRHKIDIEAGIAKELK